jgi:hypothetical protein
MELMQAIERYLQHYRATRRAVAQKTPRATPEAMWRASWRLTEMDLGLERQGVPVGPIEGRQGPPLTLET